MTKTIVMTKTTRRRIRTPLTMIVAVVAGLVAASVGLGSQIAGAADPTFTVTAGSAAAGTDVPITLTSGTVSWRDTTTAQLVACTSATLHGLIRVGTGLSGSGIGSITGSSVQFNSCTGPAGLKFRWTGFGTWSLDASNASGGVATVAISNLRMHSVTTAGPTCAWDFASSTGSFTSSSTATAAPGTLAGVYSNAAKALSVPATNPGALGLWNVNPSSPSHYCVAASFWNQGDRMSFQLTLNVSADNPAYNPIAIS